MTGELCGTMADKMPLVAHGAAQWTAAETAHLRDCPECAAEWQMIQAAARLGASEAAKLDVERLTAGALSEVKRRNARDRWGRAGWIAGLAAAAAIVAVIVTRWPESRPELARGIDSAALPTVEVGLHLPLAELESLDSTQLETVLEGLDAPMSEVEPGPSPSFGDLDNSQLERVLRSLEG